MGSYRHWCCFPLAEARIDRSVVDIFRYGVWQYMYRYKLLGLWVLVATLLVACGGAAQPTPDGNRITVVELVNRVETGRTEDAGAELDFLPAEIGQELFPGAGVKTFPNSEARVDIRVQDLLRIIRTTPNTVWRLGQFAVERETIIELE